MTDGLVERTATGEAVGFLSEYCRRLICFDELLPQLPPPPDSGVTAMVGDKARFGDWKRAGLSKGVTLGPEASLGAIGSMFIRLESSSCAVTFG